MESEFNGTFVHWCRDGVVGRIRVEEGRLGTICDSCSKQLDVLFTKKSEHAPILPEFMRTT